MVILDGSPLRISDVVAVARDGDQVEISDTARSLMQQSARAIADMDAGNTIAYGVTTGFGALADKAIAPADRATLQRALVLSHAAGAGSPLDSEVVRGLMLLRARTLCTGHSGVRAAVPEALVALINAGIVPWIPNHGSLGASGDLAPLAHAACVALGEGDVVAESGREPAADALKRAGLTPLSIGPKEGLALINGTDAMAAVLSLASADLGNLLVAADCTAAMSIEALLGTVAVFDERVVALRPATGQATSAANIRLLLRDSAIVASHRDSHHAVQDAYSLRCAPQVHGAARDLAGFARTTVENELASVVDNPVVIDGDHLVSNGNFHGQALAYAADCMALICADIAAIAERRIDRLLDPARSRGLPAFLVREPGLNSGLMIAQYTAAALVAALRHAATPLSVQSASTSAGQEDHVSMGYEAALRTRESVDRLRAVLAVEYLCASQALDLRAPQRPAPATTSLLAALRSRVAFLDADRMLAPDIEAASQLLRTTTWRDAVEGLQ